METVTVTKADREAAFVAVFGRLPETRGGIAWMDHGDETFLSMFEGHTRAACLPGVAKFVAQLRSELAEALVYKEEFLAQRDRWLRASTPATRVCGQTLQDVVADLIEPRIANLRAIASQESP